MSTHFTYEIDERKLRVKLRDIETPPSQEAWQKFDSYSNTQNKHHGHNPLKDVKLPLNRNVIIPAVFGLLIIFFSVLLFNFISIKKPVSEVGAASSAITTPEIKTQIAAPLPEVKTPTSNVASTATKINPPSVISQSSVSKTVAPSPAPGIVANKILPTPTVAVLNKVPAIALANPQSSTAVNSLSASAQNSLSAEYQASLKKKSKRRAPEVIEGDSANNNRPALGGDERDTDVRPN
ncbi:MAG: hypothetical protein IT236_06370 [Bacteroidia bacterium]|nr:hypothetical protein [Bacteroidia bacterium]